MQRLQGRVIRARGLLIQINTGKEARFPDPVRKTLPLIGHRAEDQIRPSGVGRPLPEAQFLVAGDVGMVIGMADVDAPRPPPRTHHVPPPARGSS